MGAVSVTLGRLVGPPVWALEPLIHAYGKVVPSDPWANHPDECVAWYQLVSESPAGLVLVAAVGQRLAGFCVAEVLVDKPNATRCCMIYAAYATPPIRSPQLRDDTVAALRAHACTHGASYLSTFAARGLALARWLGPEWRYAGDHNGRAYLVGRIPEAVMR